MTALVEGSTTASVYMRGCGRYAGLGHGKDMLGKVNSNGYDSHDFPFRTS